MTASNRHRFIRVAVDYFIKWEEVESYAKLGIKQVAKFIKNNLFCRYRIPHHIVSDNGVQFQGEVRELLKSYNVEHHKASPYRPQANGAIEAQSIKKNLSKDGSNSLRLGGRLPYAIWGY